MLDRDAAAALTTEIRETVDIALLIDAEKGRADAALDYSSWDRYIHAELGDVEFYATRDERQEAVHTLAEGGMSNRQIGHALHMDEKTVRGDLKALGTPEPPTVCEPVTITPSVMTSPLHYARQAQALVEEIDREGYGTDDLTPAQRDALDRLRAVLAQFSQVWEMEENDQIREGRK
jgi:hypothetical protein